MFSIKRFSSFEECKDIWQALEESTFHYPFQSWWYQNLFAQNFSNMESVYILGVFDKNILIAISAFEKKEKNTVIFLGTYDVSVNPQVEQDLTDFGDLLVQHAYSKKNDEIWNAILAYFARTGVSSFDLRYIRQDSLTYSYFLKKGVNIVQQETSPFITLPTTWDQYLTVLSRKDRHELKRKIKRLEAQTAFSICTQKTIEEKFETFIRLHRLSDPAKDKFMTERIEKFFRELLFAEKIDWETHICDLTIDSNTVASVMIFTNKTHMLLFNSGYDPAFAHLSVGLLLKAFLIKQAIEEKKHIYDFLRGSERYKYDLGAKDMPLLRAAWYNEYA